MGGNLGKREDMLDCGFGPFSASFYCISRLCPVNLQSPSHVGQVLFPSLLFSGLALRFTFPNKPRVFPLVLSHFGHCHGRSMFKVIRWSHEGEERQVEQSQVGPRKPNSGPPSPSELQLTCRVLRINDCYFKPRTFG